jgi:hypothetical protein
MTERDLVRDVMTEADDDARDAAGTGRDLVANEQGAIGYIAAWLLGVPAGLLFVVFLLRGCN